MMRAEEVPALIIGGGAAGLSASMLLAREGVGHLLVSAPAGTSDLPKAHVLNQRPSVEQNAQRSLENAINHFTIGSALGVSHDNGEEQNLANLRRMRNGRAADAEHRSTVLRHMRAQSMEFCEHNVELGYCYDSAAIVHDGSPAPDPPDPIRVYEPSTRPGSPLPHAWIDDEDGSRCAIKDLVGPGRFLLIAGEDGEDWCAGARERARAEGLPLDGMRVGHLDGDLFDPRCAWLRRREIGSQGAILVRPDRFVAWRRMGASEDSLAELSSALGQALGRPTGARAMSAA